MFFVWKEGGMKKLSLVRTTYETTGDDEDIGCITTHEHVGRSINLDEEPAHKQYIQVEAELKRIKKTYQLYHRNIHTTPAFPTEISNALSADKEPWLVEGVIYRVDFSRNAFKTGRVCPTVNEITLAPPGSMFANTINFHWFVSARLEEAFCHFLEKHWKVMRG